VLDLGCGSGQLVQALMKERQFAEIVGVDISHRALESAESRLKLDRLATRQRERVRLFQTALTYRDKRLAGFDAAAVVEVIEHLGRPRLQAFERVVFEHALRAEALSHRGATLNIPLGRVSKPPGGGRLAPDWKPFF
jgi:cyclopropane fatty-acyl-phospholipid synthase-like methyltransferase